MTQVNPTPTSPFTAEQLAEIEARAAAATAGPWHLTDAATIVAPLTTEVIADVWEPTQASRNGEFIEAARTDVPVLLAEVRRLTAERDEARTELAQYATTALPWAHVMDDGDLHEFLNDFVSAAMGRWRSDPDVPDRQVLADVEKACADWRTPGQGYRGDVDDEAQQP